MTDLPVLVDLHSNIYFDREEGEVVILDRRDLPGDISFVHCRDHDEVAKAIKDMVTQSLGVSPAAGYGMALAGYNAKGLTKENKEKIINEAANKLKNTRPTQTSLHHLVEEMKNLALNNMEKGDDPFPVLNEKAYNWTEHLMQISRDMGKYASSVLNDEDSILTHCYGGPAIYYTGHYAREKDLEVDFYVTETRPYLQGARLTSHALKEDNFDVTLLTDGMPAHCLRKNIIDVFITGADRVAMNGGIANKIGTYQIALACKEHGIPFYVHSYDGPDPDTENWENIEIEERDEKEIFYLNKHRIAPKGINGYYPAFDCTPAELIEGIITEKGIYKPNSVKNYFKD